MTRAMSWREAALMVIAAAGISACGGAAMDSTSSGGAGSEVQALATLSFSPASISIPVGGTVTWVFGSVGHTVTFDPATGAPSDIGNVNSPNANTSISRGFGLAGVYTYHCSIHPSMTGNVVVGGGVAPPPPPPPPPPPGYLKTP